MRERPILFSGPMVRAILAGAKTQTRRVIKPQPELGDKMGFRWRGWMYGIGQDDRETNSNFAHSSCHYGRPGDRLWVRETWCHTGSGVWSIDEAYLAQDGHVIYRADNTAWSGTKWFPSIHMPRWARRITLEITNIRVERVQEITNADAWQEGIEAPRLPITEPDGYQHQAQGWEGIYSFRQLWDSINASRGYGWEVNPWVWVIEFRRIVTA